jgi:membrane peptidoglycan carboxypeptidase
MMQEVVRRGTGTRAALPDRAAAGKTGTTQAARDAWFIGFTADYVAGVWMGYDDNTPLTGVTGGGLPAEIWREAMLRLHEGLPPRALDSLAPAGDGGSAAAEIAADAAGAGLRAVGGILSGLASGVAELIAHGSDGGGEGSATEIDGRHER